ncbi:YopX family protein [Paenibacillus xylanexedens]|uniref:YopX family protein n=1 Tax=Paenibacillus xylanexedens TaxID=528191 RepID=UPI0011A8E01C|nr:YopX family protein [Paenibacillus xylanexedens]
MSLYEFGARYWDAETKNMSYHFYEYGWLQVCILSPDVVLMLKSGVKDSKGKDYYDGDIVKVNKLNFESSGPLPENLVVRLYEGMFQLFRGREPLMGLHLGYIADGEVIGNIYENPEFLGGEGADTE